MNRGLMKKKANLKKKPSIQEIGSTFSEAKAQKFRMPDFKTAAKELSVRTQELTSRLAKQEQARIVKQKVLDLEVSI